VSSCTQHRSALAAGDDNPCSEIIQYYIDMAFVDEGKQSADWARLAYITAQLSAKCCTKESLDII
jgi:hypothetical protein